ncbi:MULTISPECIES: antibiotic biosynthesis monooxygenase [unclassified Campylobacter]|uniref:putative quinol monooxygenase n=1 Tax=unclassified Campylobacter TaxID=2593542 RepID=UPI001BDB4A1B|nr:MULTISPECIES: antibiotic biosynthesis monooxygenase [unclassified Campylobacter]MBT0883599.1 antibiotic biosynthesis monooxygenase [Campylobacter sp. 2018MI13]ULO03894.1 antibiotic biosynthesis family monooxygenase [Campylobacter sp. RM12651]
MKKILALILSLFGLSSNIYADDNINNKMLVRISVVEVYPEYLDEYLVIAKEVAEASIEKEKGVISIYPMMLVKNNNIINILEIYKDQESYNKHINSEHFQKYKKGTLHMVKSLELLDSYQLSDKNFKAIFKRQ